MKEKKQVQIRLFDDEFSQLAKERGVSGALVAKEEKAKQTGLNKKFSASERAKAEKVIRKLVQGVGKQGKLSTQEVIEIARKINENRSFFSMFCDLQGDHDKVYYPTEKNLKAWAKNPGASDMLGVDNKRTTRSNAGEKKGRALKVFGIFPIKTKN